MLTSLVARLENVTSRRLIYLRRSTSCRWVANEIKIVLGDTGEGCSGPDIVAGADDGWMNAGGSSGLQGNHIRYQVLFLMMGTFPGIGKLESHPGPGLDSRGENDVAKGFKPQTKGERHASLSPPRPHSALAVDCQCPLSVTTSTIKHSHRKSVLRDLPAQQ